MEWYFLLHSGRANWINTMSFNFWLIWSPPVSVLDRRHSVMLHGSLPCTAALFLKGCRLLTFTLFIQFWAHKERQMALMQDTLGYSLKLLWSTLSSKYINSLWLKQSKEYNRQQNVIFPYLLFWTLRKWIISFVIPNIRISDSAFRIPESRIHVFHIIFS